VKRLRENWAFSYYVTINDFSKAKSSWLHHRIETVFTSITTSTLVHNSSIALSISPYGTARRQRWQFQNATYEDRDHQRPLFQPRCWLLAWRASDGFGVAVDIALPTLSDRVRIVLNAGCVSLAEICCVG
jgi:hypothetical protein